MDGAGSDMRENVGDVAASCDSISKCLLDGCGKAVNANQLREHCHKAHLPLWMQDEGGGTAKRRVHVAMWLLQVANKIQTVDTLTVADLKQVLLSKQSDWLSLGDLPMNECDHAICQAVCLYLGEPVADQFNPVVHAANGTPFSVGLCGHWMLLMKLLNRLSPDQQQLVKHLPFNKSCGWDMVDAHFHIDRLAAKYHLSHGVDKVLQVAPQPPPSTRGVLSEAIANFCDSQEYGAIPGWLAEPAEVTLYATVGLHPKQAADLSMEELKRHISQMMKLQNHPRVVGVGEVGLDYSLPDISTDTARRNQQEILHCIFASVPPATPVVIHCRNDNAGRHRAELDILDILRACPVPFPVQLHCFTGTADTATAYLGLEREVYFSLSHHSLNTKNFRQVVGVIPQDRMLVETDSPYLSPLGRHSNNSPRLVGMVAEKLAGIVGMPLQQLLWITAANTRRLFRLP